MTTISFSKSNFKWCHKEHCLHYVHKTAATAFAPYTSFWVFIKEWVYVLWPNIHAKSTSNSSTHLKSKYKETQVTQPSRHYLEWYPWNNKSCTRQELLSIYDVRNLKKIIQLETIKAHMDALTMTEKSNKDDKAKNPKLPHEHLRKIVTLETLWKTSPVSIVRTMFVDTFIWTTPRAVNGTSQTLLLKYLPILSQRRPTMLIYLLSRKIKSMSKLPSWISLISKEIFLKMTPKIPNELLGPENIV